jgi:hypothetical protein
LAKDDRDQPPRRGGGGKLSRTETVTVRLDPKLRYLAELAARKQRRTLSSFIEWVIEESLSRVRLTEATDLRGNRISVADEAAELWDVDEPDRFVKLALCYPDMLTHEEQILWKLVREHGVLWLGHAGGEVGAWEISQNKFRFEIFRKYWTKFVAVARGDAAVSTLPTWDDELPF